MGLRMGSSFSSLSLSLNLRASQDYLPIKQNNNIKWLAPSLVPVTSQVLRSMFPFLYPGTNVDISRLAYKTLVLRVVELGHLD